MLRRQPLSTKADIYSFGVVMWEVTIIITNYQFKLYYYYHHHPSYSYNLSIYRYLNLEPSLGDIFLFLKSSNEFSIQQASPFLNPIIVQNNYML